MFLKSRPPPPHAAHLASPEVRAAIEGALRRRSVPPHEIEDMTHDVIERALVTRTPPASLEECTKLVTKIARDAAIDRVRRERSRAKFDAGPCEDPDAAHDPATGEGRDPVEVRERVDFILRQVDEGTISGRQARMFVHAVDDVSCEEIAAEMKLARQTVKNELSAGRRAVRASWEAFAAAGAVALAVVVGWVCWPRDRVAIERPHDDGPLAPLVPAGPSPVEEARGVRGAALRECDAGRWGECLAGLDRAAALDPAGEEDPAVKRARAEAAKGLRQPPVPLDQSYGHKAPRH